MENKESILNLTVQYLKKHSSAVQQLAHRGWHQVDQARGVTDGGGRGGGRW